MRVTRRISETALVHEPDYLQEARVDTIWLLPFYPSSLQDDGYDVTEYYHLYPDYGTRRGDRRNCVIVVSNLSQFFQAPLVDLSMFRDCETTEVRSENSVVKVERKDYPLTLTPYGYFWFEADKSGKRGSEASGELPLLKTTISWERLFKNYNEQRTLNERCFRCSCRSAGGSEGRQYQSAGRVCEMRFQ